MEYIKEVDGWKEDGLIAGTEHGVSIYNVQVSEGAEISRGDLICGSSLSGEFAPVSGAADASKVLLIAADDFTAASTSPVIRAYASGVFNREKITFGGASLTTEPFEQALRTQNIHLRGLQDS